jgi:hypothetical protein
LGGLRALIAENNCSHSTRRKITKVFAINAAKNAQVGEGLFSKIRFRQKVAGGELAGVANWPSFYSILKKVLGLIIADCYKYIK